MQPFNLTRLNMFSPYPVWQNNNESYTFRTDFGIIFRVIFTKKIKIFDKMKKPMNLGYSTKIDWHHRMTLKLKLQYNVL